MRILMVGDIVGRPGREAAIRLIPKLRNELEIDFVVANGENAAGGLGITADIAGTLFKRAEVDVITLGNHAWSKREVYDYLDREPRVLRPANYPPGAPGMGYGVYDTPYGPVGVASVQGRVFMEPVDDPFRAIDAILADIAGDTPTVLVDIHAEATSEKQAMGWYLAGRVTAVVGTHTHIQTADERVLPGGTAYITDVGMTGPTDGVIGVQRELVIGKFRSGLPARFEPAMGATALNAVTIEVDNATGRARSIARLQVSAGDQGMAGAH